MYDFVNCFYNLMKIQFKRAGRTDYEECMNDLLKGDDARFMREFGVKLTGIEQYKIIHNGNLPVHLKGKIQQMFFAEWINQMDDNLRWRSIYGSSSNHRRFSHLR